ncbi:MAG: tRNA preQ1(34) S-adenosylmethionine ribosyltransferase-isomerase QueA [Actinobacteria bacterium]|nr:tRNA preQ1(34) S-adenosylmethionine ribosyltransferase-isomerase QueA [Actinomycetota bacterium]
MRLDELDFAFPEELIAQRPSEPRDACRLLVVDRNSGALSHRIFRDLPTLLRPGDVLVVNESRVLPARVWAHKKTGGRVELLFLRRADRATESHGHEKAGSTAEGREVWEVLARPSSRLRAGVALTVGHDTSLTLQESLGDGRWLLSHQGAPDVLDLLERYGAMPLPPYIRTPLQDPDEYQTVYATVPGSAAAPTAGLHFTPTLLSRLGEVGVQIERVTLHVGADTFRPVSAEQVEEHQIHTETYHVEQAVAERLDRARAEGRRLVAVGTTAVRVLETVYGQSEAREGVKMPATGATDVFITPGYRFRAVDALITNFHLPRTSLLALVMAFGGVQVVRNAYQEAVERRYRLFSFGDAMLLTGGDDLA